MKHTHCRICGERLTHEVLDLGHQPLADKFLSLDELSLPEIYYPLKLMICDKCELPQLNYIVPNDILYDTSYPYETGANEGGIEHFDEFAATVVTNYNLDKNSLVVDIGCNDGTLLRAFKNFGMKVVGVEPVKRLMYILSERELDAYHGFFGRDAVEKITDRHGKADVVTATNVFAHIDDLNRFVDTVKTLLKPDGVFVVEMPNFLEMATASVLYDSIYHEHLSYFHPYPLKILLQQHNMYVEDYEHYRIHCGSTRYYIKNGDGGIIEPDGVFPILIDRMQNYVIEHRRRLKALLDKYIDDGKIAVGVGASAKGNTLLNYCNIGKEKLLYITEKLKQKIGNFTPGMHIPIVSDRKLIEDQPDYVLLLAWNWQNEIIKSLRKKGYKGKFIVPFPYVKVLSI